MLGRAMLTLALGIFWFLYPPKAYAECSKCKAKVEWLKSQRELAEASEFKNYDADKTSWSNKQSSDQPVKIKKKKADVGVNKNGAGANSKSDKAQSSDANGKKSGG